jgi:hypothetical protein
MNIVKLIIEACRQLGKAVAGSIQYNGYPPIDSWVLLDRLDKEPKEPKVADEESEVSPEPKEKKRECTGDCSRCICSNNRGERS